MKSLKPNTWIEVCLWAVLIAGSLFLFSGCDLQSGRDPHGNVQAVICSSYNSPAQDCVTWTDGRGSLVATLVLAFVNAGVIPPKAPAPPCPAINFSQASTQETVAFDSTGAIIYMIPLYRQPDGNYTAEGFSVPAGSANAVGTKLGTITQAQSYFASCRGLGPWTPAPHPTVLGDMPGTMSRDIVATNLGGPPYAMIKADSAHNKISVSLDTQDTLGSSSTDYPVANGPTSLLVADFNGDGKRDVATLNQTGTDSTGNGSVSILLGNGDGTLRASARYSTDGQYPVAMTSFNLNGRANLAVVNRNDNTVTVLLANADGSMRTAVPYPLLGGPFQAMTIVAADFDGDGKADLMVNSTNQGYVLLRGNGDGTFQAAVQKAGYTPHNYPLFLTPGDFNKDGKIDLAALNADGTVTILLNAGDGSFPNQSRYVVGTPLSSGAYGLGMFAVDFNDDGNLDLVFGTGHPDALYPDPMFVTVLLGKGDGTFQGAAPVYPVGYGALAMATADFNGDGRGDLVAAANGSAFSYSLWILPGQGGGFQPATEVAVPAVSYIRWVTTADLNGDGRADLIAVDSPYQMTGHVYTLLGKNDGTFQAPTSYAAGIQPTFVTTGDVNGDGLTDLVISYGDRSATKAGVTTALLLTGKSGGGFNAGVTVPTGVNTIQVALADVNGDGKPDLVAVNLGIVDFGYFGTQPAAGNVSVSLGNGNGTFQAPVNYTAGVNPTWVAVGDVNGDGKPDLIAGAVTGTASKIGVLLGNGNGAFGAATLLSTYSWPGSLALTDFDGDGKLDLAIVHLAGDPPVTIMQGNGDGTFQPETVLLAGDGPVAVIAADFTGNGRSDLAVLNQAYFGWGSVNLFHNISAAPACTFSLNSGAQSFTAPGGTGSFKVTTGSGCNWAAASSADWIRPAFPTLGINNGTVNFSVLANTGAARSGALTVGGQTVTVNQAGAPAATHFSVSAPGSATAAVSFNFTIAALDANNNTVTGYTGTVHFSSTDGAAALPANATLTNGTGAFAATLKTAGNQTIMATETAISGVTGTSAPIVVTGPVAPPAPVSVSLAGGNGSSSTYTFVYTDPRGYQDMNVLNVLVSNSLDALHACYLAYVAPINTLILVNDAGQAGGPYAGVVALGSSTPIQNGQCSVTLVSATGSGNTLTLVLTIAWTTSFAALPGGPAGGDKIVYMAAGDLAARNSGWYPLGVWRAPGSPQTVTTAVVGMSPFRGNGTGPAPFTFNFSDTQGFQDFGVLNILVNGSLDGLNACYLAFAYPYNVMFLLPDNGIGLLPGQSMGAPGSVSNSQCTVSWGSAAVNASGNNLALNLNITFTAAFAGNRIFYVAARDVSQANNTDWHAMGTWTAQ